VPAWRQTGKRGHRIDAANELSLHHLYRAMAWLGRNKDSVEKALFMSTRDLFTELDMVFFDTTSIYFVALPKVL